MTNMRFSVGRRRTVIENIGSILLLLQDGLLEDLFFFPELFDLSLPFHELHIAIYFFKHVVLLLIPLVALL